MRNLNELTRKKQQIVLVGVLIAAAAASGIVYYFANDNGTQSAPADQNNQPDMTGLIDSSFTTQVSKSAITQEQERTAALEDQVRKLTAQLSSNSSQQQTINSLQQQVSQLISKMANPTPPPVQQGNSKTNWTVTPNNPGAQSHDQQQLTFPDGQGTNSYNLPPVKPHIGGLKHTDFKWRSKEKTLSALPWISSGSFINATMVEGADANASVTGDQSSTPVVFTLLGNVSLPNGKQYNLDQCRVTGEIYGDISSERGEVRTHNIACDLKDGKHIDMPFQGHVSYQGKEGIRGKPVMRNGAILLNAGGAGFLSGIGSGFQSASTTSVGVGATATPGAGDIFRQGIGGGASQAANTLSQYYIRRAEQYHAVIDIGAGNAVTVVFQQGFRLTTIEDKETEDAIKNGVQKASDSVSDSVDNSVNNASSELSNGPKMINPDDVIRKAKNLDLGQTIQ